jgi:hypothetical protein
MDFNVGTFEHVLAKYKTLIIKKSQNNIKVLFKQG